MSASSEALARLLITPGEPAGIGPDLILALAAKPQTAQLVAVADPDLLRSRARQLGLSIRITETTADAALLAHQAGCLPVIPVALSQPCSPGQLDPSNARYVLECLDVATDACLQKHAHALVTGPVQKSVINDAGIAFTGHTEYLADRCGTPRVVMMLAGAGLRVALATTHLPLRSVADHIEADSLEQTLRILNRSLQHHFGAEKPAIAVLGLNPHAGENGHLGKEEQTVITPVLERLRAEGMTLEGPLPADTAFSPQRLINCDAFLAMFHDQGLPVLKYAAFGKAVNITLGLPILRCSVDHGTALELAGTGEADPGSLQAAVDEAQRMAIPR